MLGFIFRSNLFRLQFNPFLIEKFRFDCVDRPLRWIAALDRQYPISNSRRAMTDRNRLATGTLRPSRNARVRATRLPFRESDRSQPITLPGNLEGWLDGDDLAHFIVEVKVVMEIPAPSKVRMILFH